MPSVIDEAARRALTNLKTPGANTDAATKAYVDGLVSSGGSLNMVQEHTTWFSDKVGLGVPVQVGVDERVAPGSFRPEELRKKMTDRAWRPGRRELWGLALGLFTEHPGLGVGPDTFRWRPGLASAK